MPSSSSTRRSFLRTASSAALGGGLASCGFTPTRFESRSMPPRDLAHTITVDPHCHIFNGKDVDVTGYALALTRDYTKLAGYALLRGFVTGYLDALAYTAPSLREEMCKLEEVIAAVGPYHPGDAHRQEVFREKLVSVMGKPQAVPDLEARCKWFPHNIFTHPGRTGGSRLAREMIDHFRHCLEKDENEDVQTYLRKETMSEQQRRALYQVQKESAWLLVHFVNYRTLNAYELWRCYNRNPVTGGTSQAPAIDLFVPSLPDMNAWFSAGVDQNRRDETLRIAEHKARGLRQWDSAKSMMGYQMEFMEKVSVLFHGEMMPMIGYCPRFAAACARHRYAYEHPLKMIDRALNKQGCLGVKVYPPMGFRAWNNSELDSSLFSRGFSNGSDLEPVDGQAAPPLGAAMDAELRKFYRYCGDHDVPIVAHTCPTHGSKIGYALRTDPAFWQQAIQEMDLPRLRLTLAHFGGWRPDDWLTRQLGGSDQHNWAEKIARMMTTLPNVYADISDSTEIAKEGWQEQFAEARRNWKNKSSRREDGFGARDIDSKLTYGSDWFVNAQVDLLKHDDRAFLTNDNKRVGRTYAARWADFLRKNTSAEADIMGHNALRFLGLNTAKTRRRVDSFFETHGIPVPNWRKKLDQVMPL